MQLLSRNATWPRSRRGVGAVLTTLGAFALLAGCGDDDAPIEPIEASTTPDAGAFPPASSEDFVAAADPRCADTLETIAGLEDGTSAGSLTLLASQERQLTAALIADLQTLNPPNETAVGEFFDALEEQVKVLRKLEAAAESNDTATYEVLEGELVQAKADALAAATDAGFEECGEDGESVEAPSTGTTPSGGTPAPAPAPVPTPAPAPVPTTPVAPPTGGTDPSAPTVPPETPAPPDGGGSSGGIGPG